MPLYAFEGDAPDLAPRHWIAPTAVLIGRVRLERDASVWWNAVLRGDIEWITIGEESNVQDNVVCHTEKGAPLTVGAGVTVGHSAVLHGCVVEDGCLVGMSATVLSFARIGAGSVIGAGAVVAEGKQIPPRSLVLGTPGRVVRTLEDDEVATFRSAAERYVTNWRRYSASCHAL